MHAHTHARTHTRTHTHTHTHTEFLNKSDFKKPVAGAHLPAAGCIIINFQG